MVSKKTKQLTLDAMLAATCTLLGYIALSTGTVRVTFESLPIHLGALLFGPISGIIIGVTGTFIYQISAWGFTATTFLWILPYFLTGLFVGMAAKKRCGSKFTSREIIPALPPKFIFAVTLFGEFMMFVLNTCTLYIDSKIMGYNPLILANLPVRFLIFVVKVMAYSVILPKLLNPLRRISHS